MDELFICGAAFIVLATSKSPGSHLESIIINFLNCPDHSVQCHCHDAQKTDREDKPIHFEELKRQKTNWPSFPNIENRQE